MYFRNGSKVPTSTQVKYLGSMVCWKQSFGTAFKHRSALAEQAYKKLRLVWNSSLPSRTKLRIFAATFPAVFTYGLDAFTLTDKHLQRIDGFYFRFLRRIIGIKASYYSRITNSTVYHKAGKPKLPSESIVQLQHKMLSEVFLADMQEPIHNVVFCNGYKGRIRSIGRRRGRGRYWLEECCHRFYPEEFLDHTACNTNWRYVLIKRKAPKRAQAALRARH